MAELVKDVWEARRDSILEHLEILKSELQRVEIERQDAGKSGIPRKAVLDKLIIGLYEYGTQHFKYFFDLLRTRDTLSFEDKHHNNELVILKREYVLRQVIERMATDARVISQAIQQRVFYQDSTDGQLILDTLAKADKIAYAALQPAVNKGILSGNWTALTYFMRDAQVRVIPYANVALVGIPLTCTREPRDFLAIPHEVGHSVYWNAHLPGSVKNKMWRDIEHSVVDTETREPIIWLRKWAEEVFADVYGALVAGPSIGLSFQQLAEESDKHDFEGDDGHHPTPLLRAQVYFEALQQSGKEAEAIELVKRWRGVLKKLGYHKSNLSGSEDNLRTAAVEPWGLLPDDLMFNVWDDEDLDGPRPFTSRGLDSHYTRIVRVGDAGT
ncbi:MAG: hypothetical protein U0694_28200 [Anaerolineae bacterium]